MASSSRALLLLAIAVAAVVGTAHGASYTVGAPAGSWDLRTNYANWASTINFRAGDQLVFKYSPSTHDVLEVSKADYDSCTASSPIATFQSGDDTISLPAGGVTRYFICGVPGHCSSGMKLTVRVEAGAPTTGPNAAAPSSPMTPRAAGPSVAPPPPTSSAASAGSVGSLAGLGLAAVVAGLMAFY